ncbi:MAG: metallophosphoesterase [Ignavibacterium sp.]|nr:MAG: metallophosphoesterase [Ignavibacterium sp.]
MAIDFYAYSGAKKLTQKYSQRIRQIVFFLFWIVPALLITALILFAIFNRTIDPANVIVYFHYISGTFILFYVPKLVFIIFNLFDDLIHLGRTLYKKSKRTREQDTTQGELISRKLFLTRTGIVIAGLPFISIAYGIKWGKFNYTTRNFTLRFSNLPASFDGLRIVQISDFHIGSFLNSIDEVEVAVELINEQNADLLLFTGDIVNNLSSEMDKFIPILNKLKASIGKFSILGNHDYGDYVPWNSMQEKRQNFDRLINLQEDIGFNMLINHSQKISLNGEEIELVGVENWGLPPFPQYGDLSKALSNTTEESFKILMSHDPTHWDEEVLDKTNIDLTLSGHTHGAQFGIEIPGWRWSPVNMRYKRWGGLYTEGKQSLYVNTGIGFIGFPGRVGMPPEIAVIELNKA